MIGHQVLKILLLLLFQLGEHVAFQIHAQGDTQGVSFPTVLYLPCFTYL